MSFLLDLVYLLLLVAATPWLAWSAWKKGKYREGFAAKLLGHVPRRAGDRPCVWLHAVSVGEVNLLFTFIADLVRRRPDWECVVSTTTQAGYALAKKKYPGLSVFYCPLDFSWAVRAALGRIRPALLVLAELELWPNLIRAAGRRGVKVAIVNGRLSEHSFRGYRRLRPLVSRLLRRIDLIAVQADGYAARFRALGAAEATLHVTGNVKFDGAATDRRHAATQRLAAAAGFRPDDIVFLAGSTQEPEESLALDAFLAHQSAHPKLRLVLAPRHPDRFAAVADLLTARGVAWQRRSVLESQPADNKARVLLVDCIGELAAWWGTATIGFVGGSLTGRGGQNMIEPAAYGVAVAFGPNTHNFRDVVAALLAADAAVVVLDGKELAAFVGRCLDQPQFAAELGSLAAALVARQLGATRRTMDLVERLIDQPTGEAKAA